MGRSSLSRGLLASAAAVSTLSFFLLSGERDSFFGCVGPWSPVLLLLLLRVSEPCQTRHWTMMMMTTMITIACSPAHREAAKRGGEREREREQRGKKLRPVRDVTRRRIPTTDRRTAQIPPPPLTTAQRPTDKRRTAAKKGSDFPFSAAVSVPCRSSSSQLFLLHCLTQLLTIYT